MAIGLNDLRKHLLSQSKVEPLHVVSPPEKPVVLQSLDDRRDATEPQIYSVRKLLQNVSPDLEPVEQPAAVANPSSAVGGVEARKVGRFCAKVGTTFRGSVAGVG